MTVEYIVVSLVMLIGLGVAAWMAAHAIGALVEGMAEKYPGKSPYVVMVLAFIAFGLLALWGVLR